MKRDSPALVPHPEAAVRKRPGELTKREWEVALLVAEGLTNRAIADRLFVSERTAEYHLEQIRNKLGFDTRSQVAVWAAGRPGPAVLEPAVGTVPLWHTTYIGREAETDQVIQLLRSSQLITITGPAGVGKSRFATAAAAAAAPPGGLWFVDLAAAAEGQNLLHLVLAALSTSRSADPQLRLQQANGILLLDNCEHLTEPVAELVASLLSVAPGLRLVATSRESLRVDGEAVWPLGPLPLAESVRLYAERARLVAPGFKAGPEVEAICVQLDGLPLAIELAAAWMRLLPPADVLERMAADLDFPSSRSRSPIPRQQTLEAALDWSYDLLREPEQRLLRALAIIPASFDQAAAVAVCPADGGLEQLAALVDKSLLGAGGEGRFRLLETVRRYGLAKLAASGERVAVQDRYRTHFSALLDGTMARLRGPEQVDWDLRISAEIDNLRQVLAGLDGSPDQLAGAVELIPFWTTRGLFEEGRGWLSRALASHPEADALRALALSEGGWLPYRQGGWDEAGRMWKEALDIHRGLGDRPGAADMLTQLGLLESLRGDHAGAAVRIGEAEQTAREAGDPRALATALHCAGLAAIKADDLRLAATRFESALAAQLSAGDAILRTYPLAALALVRLQLGDRSGAEAALEEALPLLQGSGFDWGLATLIGCHAALAAAAGSHARALRLWGASEALFQALNAVPSPFTEPLLRVWVELSSGILGPDAGGHLSAGRSLRRDEALQELTALSTTRSRPPADDRDPAPRRGRA